MINEDARYYFRRIRENCFLESKDEEKLVNLYINSPEGMRDEVLRNVSRLSETRDVAIRAAIREKIRRS
jgi:hypothetical protein